MKKRILCLVLALVLVGSAVGFFVYDKVGNTFNYAKNPGKYVTLGDTNYIKTLYTGGKTQPDEVTDADLQAAIAKALASLQDKNGVGNEDGVVKYDVIKMYDTLRIIYKAEVKDDNKVISKAETLDPTKETWVQLGADSDLARLLVEHLLGMKASDSRYRAYTKSDTSNNDILKGDKIVFSYTVNGAAGEDRENLDTRVNGDQFLSAIETKEGVTGLTALFLEKVNNKEAKIGEALTLEIGEGDSKKTFVMTVDYVLRDWVIAGKANEGEYIYFTTSTDGEETKIHHGLLSQDLDTAFGEGFSKKLAELEIGTESEITVDQKITNSEGTESTVTKTYKVKIERVEGGRENTDTLPDSDVSRAEKWFTFTKTYDENSDAKADNDEAYELKNKTVTYSVAVVNVKTFAYNYANITDETDGLKYSAETDSELAKLFKAYDAYKDAKKELDDAKDTDLTKLRNALDKAEDDLLAAEIAYIDTLKPEDGSALKAYYDAVKKLIDARKALAEAEAAEGTTEEKKTELRTAVDDARTDVENKLADYAKDEKIYLDDLKYVDIAARGAYEKQETETLEDEKKDKLAYEIAKEVWNKLLEDAGKTVKYPGKAVRVAYRGLVDGHKTNYYENRDKSPYSDYSTFKSYLKNSAYSGKDYKVELTNEAKEIVLEQLVMYRLIEMYDVELKADQESTLKFFEQYGATDYANRLRTGYLFDNLMQKIAEEICPAVAKTESK